jgi:hypothetical protein
MVSITINGKRHRITIRQAQAWLAECQRRASEKGRGAGERGIWQREAFRLQDAIQAATR